MGVNISGKGVLSGLATLVAGVVNSLNLLVTRIIGYTNTGGGGSSYYTTLVENSVNGFVAQSESGSLAFSTNGTDWIYNSEHPLYPGWTNNIIAANGKIYCFAGTRFVYSSDGISWTRGVEVDQQENVTILSHMQPPVYINNMFLSLNGNVVAYSTDGLNWADKYMVEGYTDYMNISSTRQILFGNNTYFTMNESTGQSLVSSNGIDWSLGFNFNPSQYGDFKLDNTIFEGGRFVTVSRYGQTLSSTDGITWTVGSGISLAQSEPVYIVGYEDGIYFAVGYAGTTAWSSNGSSWNVDYSNNNDNNANINYLTEFFSSDGKVIAYPEWVDSDSQYLHSVDKVNWTVQTFPAFSINTRIRFSEFLDKTIMVSNGQTEAEYGLTKTSTDLINWVDGFTFYNPVPAVRYQGAEPQLLNRDWFAPQAVSSSIRIETQVSIGDQGTEGAEIIAPVDVYTVPANTTTDIDEVRVKNTSANTITYDLGVLDTGVTLTDQNALINDQAISAGATATITNISNPLTAGKRIVLFPSAVDVVEVKVYGTESVPPTVLNFLSMNDGWSVVRNDESGNIRFQFMNAAVATALAATPSPANNGWVGATFTISNASGYMGGTVPSVFSETFTVTSSSVVNMAPMGNQLYLTTSNTTPVNYDLKGTASVVLP
jgi:hypothetical protein